MVKCSQGGVLNKTEDPSSTSLVIDTHLDSHQKDATLLQVQKEGRLSYWLLRAVFGASSWANEQSLCNMTQPNPAQLLPGYEILEDIRLNQPGERSHSS